MVLARREQSDEQFRAYAGSAERLNRCFYLSTAPEFFSVITGSLKRSGMNRRDDVDVRVVIEKPFGSDLASARALQEQVSDAFRERQIFRVDHYLGLGKETVQNILAFRFANAMFEPVWNRQYIDHVQITVAEDIGVGTRAAYYDRAGALRDLVQNHMLQLLALICMEPPSSLEADAVRDEKVKILRAVTPPGSAATGVRAVRAQYAAGSVHGRSVPGYLDEKRTPGAPLATPPAPRWREQIDWHPSCAADGAAERLLRGIWEGPAAVLERPSLIDVVGHRVVHGGSRYRTPTPGTDDVKQEVACLAAFAPLHNLAGLHGIGAAERVIGPSTPQVAVFDTAFHSDLPPAAYTYAGTRELLDAGLRRFGFHGINHHYIAHRAANLLDRDLTSLRLLTCHLGSGGSLAAMRDGRSVDTTMGFTPLDGLAMETRSGSVDPGLLLHLLRSSATTPEALDEVLNHRSGLAGLAGRQGTCATSSTRSSSREGIGEHAAIVRAAALEPFSFLGIELDAGLNSTAADDADVAAPASPGAGAGHRRA
jgi:acetate kinase